MKRPDVCLSDRIRTIVAPKQSVESGPLEWLISALKQNKKDGKMGEFAPFSVHSLLLLMRMYPSAMKMGLYKMGLGSATPLVIKVGMCLSS